MCNLDLSDRHLDISVILVCIFVQKSLIKDLDFLIIKAHDTSLSCKEFTDLVKLLICV